jgi:hypothetical protein
MRIHFNWGTGIALAYTSFALATSAFVVFAMDRHVDLVSPDYYAQSLHVDQRLEAERNARTLGAALSVVQASGRMVRISLPESQARTARGTIDLYRASDARADARLALAPDRNGHHDVSLAGLAAGHWILQLRWTAEGREFYIERPVVAR